MKINTKQIIIDYIKKKGPTKPQDLARDLDLYPTGLYRHLKKLIDDKILLKVGTAPKVFYVLRSELKKIPSTKLEPQVAKFINKRYLYIDPKGRLLEGIEGFAQWVLNIKQEKFYAQLAKEYVKSRRQADHFFHNRSWIDATEKFKQTFSDNAVDQVFYQDFYSLPKFGKTKLGQLVLHAKQAEHKKLIRQVAELSQPVINKLIKSIRIDAIAYIPHSLPRQVPFLKEFSQNLAISLPKIKLVKAYAGEVPVAQKGLKKLEERIENARETIYLQDTNIKFNHILLIDDAVGSGSTFNEVAKKIKHQGVDKVSGFAVVGSLKGFSVIQQV